MDVSSRLCGHMSNASYVTSEVLDMPDVWLFKIPTRSVCVERLGYFSEEFETCPSAQPQANPVLVH